MSTRNMLALLLYALGLILGLASILMAYTGLPGDFDTEPILAFALFLVAIAGIISLKD
jgi:hypothetical protein